MKKTTTIWLVLFVIVIVGVAWYAFLRKNTSITSSSTVTSTASSSSTVTMANVVNYYCTTGTISATYSTGTVALALSDGRNINLSQTMSGSGIRYEVASGSSQIVFSSEGNDAFLTENNKNTYNNCVAGSETPATTGMTTYTDASSLFSVTYPNQFIISGGELGYTTNWRSETTSTGMQLAVVTIPSSFQPKTNFVGATFTFGTSADPNAVINCLTAGNGDPIMIASVVINGVPFNKLSYADVGAGNLYEITSYRTLRNNQCYAAEYVIHSVQLANFPLSRGITAFSSSTVESILEGIVQSIKFLQ